MKLPLASVRPGGHPARLVAVLGLLVVQLALSFGAGMADAVAGSLYDSTDSALAVCQAADDAPAPDRPHTCPFCSWLGGHGAPTAPVVPPAGACPGFDPPGQFRNPVPPPSPGIRRPASRAPPLPVLV